MKDYTTEEIDSIIAWAKSGAYRVLITPLQKPTEDTQVKHEPICLAPGVSIIDLEKSVAYEIVVLTGHPGNPTFYCATDRLYQLKKMVEEKESYTPDSGE